MGCEELVVVETVGLVSLAGGGEAIAPARSCEKDLHSESASWSEKKEEARVMGPGLMLLMPIPPSGRGGRANEGREGAGLVSKTPPPPSPMATEDLLSLPSMEPWEVKLCSCTDGKMRIGPLSEEDYWKSANFPRMIFFFVGVC